MATPLSNAGPSSHALYISQRQTKMHLVEDVDSINQTIRKVWARVLGMDERQVGGMASTAQILSNATMRELAMCCLSEAQSRARIAAGDDNEDPPPFSLL